MSVTVIGTTGAPLGDAARRAIASADLLVGSRRALALTDADLPRVELGPLDAALARIAAADRPVVLASGDPGWFGIVRALRAAGHDCRVHPAVSSVATAYARVGLPWDDAVVVSAHGRGRLRAVNACRALGNVAVLTGPGTGPAALARELDGWPRELVVAERLGQRDERVIRASATEVAAAGDGGFTDPNVVLCLDPDRPSAMRSDTQPAAAPDEGWALPEQAYAHRNSMITKAEVRAWVVARLRPRLGRLVLDVGAGSGSVGIECNRLGAAVIAVDRDADAAALVRDNAAAHGARVRVVHGAAPDALACLPHPDAAFVGGGGTAAVRAVVQRRVETVVAAFAALDHAVQARRLLSESGYTVDGVQLSAARFADLPDGSVRLAATNPVLVVAGQRP